MNKIIILLLMVLMSTISFCQKIETVYLDKKGSTKNLYIAVVPQNGQIHSFMFLLDGFGNHSPQSILVQTDLPEYAAEQNILTIIPILKTGALYFGSDTASQRSLKEIIELVAAKYKLQGKTFISAGFPLAGHVLLNMPN